MAYLHAEQKQAEARNKAVEPKAVANKTGGDPDEGSAKKPVRKRTKGAPRAANKTTTTSNKGT